MLTLSTVKAIPSSRTTSSIVIAPNAKSQTFLFADPAGYTALTEAHGDEAAAASCSAIRRIGRTTPPKRSRASATPS